MGLFSRFGAVRRSRAFVPVAFTVSVLFLPPGGLLLGVIGEAAAGWPGALAGFVATGLACACVVVRIVSGAYLDSGSEQS
jgi:hypothetical protein